MQQGGMVVVLMVDLMGAAAGLKGGKEGHRQGEGLLEIHPGVHAGQVPLLPLQLVVQAAAVSRAHQGEGAAA